jgi:hypothetical protein
MNEILKKLTEQRKEYWEQMQISKSPDYWRGKASGLTLAIEIIEEAAQCS